MAGSAAPNATRRGPLDCNVEEPWAAAVINHTVTDAVRDLEGLREGLRRLKAAELDLVGQSQLLELGSGTSARLLVDTRRRLRALQTALRKKSCEISGARAVVDAARGRSAQLLLRQAGLDATASGGQHAPPMGSEDEVLSVTQRASMRQAIEPFVERALIRTVDRCSARLFPVRGRGDLLRQSQQAALSGQVHAGKEESARGEECARAELLDEDSPSSPGSSSEDLEAPQVPDPAPRAQAGVGALRNLPAMEKFRRLRAPSEAAFVARVRWANLCGGAWDKATTDSCAQKLPQHNHEVLPLLAGAAGPGASLHLPLTLVLAGGRVSCALVTDEEEAGQAPAPRVRRVALLEGLSASQLAAELPRLLDGRPHAGGRPGLAEWVVKRCSPGGRGPPLMAACGHGSDPGGAEGMASMISRCRPARARVRVPKGAVGDWNESAMPVSMADLQDVVCALAVAEPSTVSAFPLPGQVLGGPQSPNGQGGERRGAG